MTQQESKNSLKFGSIFLNTLASVIMGILLGQIVPELINRTGNPFIPIFFSILFLTFGCFICAVVLHFAIEKMSKERDSIIQQYQSFQEAFEPLQKVIEEKVEFEYVAKSVVQRAGLFQRMITEIEKAKESIMIVNYFSGLGEEETRNDNFEAAAVQKRNEYYEKLCEQAHKLKHQYMRLVQLDDSTQPVNAKISNTAYLEHFQAILGEAPNPDDPASKMFIYKMGLIRPATFIIIDEHTLLWQIDQIVKTSKGFRAEMHGMFIIYDKLGQVGIIQELQHQFANRSRSSVTLEELQFPASLTPSDSQKNDNTGTHS